MVDEATVRSWLSEVTERIRTKTAEAARLQADIAADARRQAALEALLAANRADAEAPKGLAVSEASGDHGTLEQRTVSVHPIEQGAIEILGERSTPILISELRAALASRGIPIPGKGTDANVIVYLSGSNEICRVGRGLYALRAWGVP